MLLSNPYAVLGNDPPPTKPVTGEKTNAKLLYNVVLGEERVECGAGEVPVESYMSSTTSTTFYGNCHNCKYRAHSQRQCPLRRCTKCGSFGHAASICGINRLEEFDEFIH